MYVCEFVCVCVYVCESDGFLVSLLLFHVYMCLYVCARAAVSTGNIASHTHTHTHA